MNSMNGENGAVIWGRGDIVPSRGGGNSTLIDLVNTEGKRERV